MSARTTPLVKPDMTLPRGTCRRCREPITQADGRPNLRRTWHPECAEAHRWETMPAIARAAVWQRDRSVCAECGTDVDAFEQTLLAKLEFERCRTQWHMRDLLRRLGWGRVNWPRDLWEMDHQQPLHRGGKHELGNLRTLCVPCHKAKTADEARARAAERRAS